MADEIKPQETSEKHPKAERIRYIRDNITLTWTDAKQVTSIPKETPGYWKLRKEYSNLLYKKEQEGQIDSLTRLLNRSGTLKRIDVESKRVKRREGKMSIFYIDLNDLKQTNDKVSHAAGDTLLKNFAKVATEGARPNDIVGRLGGDEFIIALPDTDIPNALKYWQRKDKEFKDVSVWISAGLTEINPDNIDQSLNEAEAEMRKAKILAKERLQKIGLRDNVLQTALKQNNQAAK